MSPNSRYPCRKSLDISVEQRDRLRRESARTGLAGTAIIRATLDHVLSRPTVLRQVLKDAEATRLDEAG